MTTLRELHLSALSDLRYSYRETLDGRALVVAFSGSYGPGSLGNGDGEFISAVTLAGVVAFGGGCLILDFSAMDYSWGNTLLKVFGDVSQYMNEPGEPDFPVLVVTSERCRPAFLSLIGRTDETAPEWHFSNLEEALGAAWEAAKRWYDG